jgi:hypothetical protein
MADVEIAGCLEPPRQFPAFGGLIEIVEGSGNMIDISGDNVPEQKKLYQGRSKQQHPVSSVAEGLDEFLDYNMLYAPEHFIRSFF